MEAFRKIYPQEFYKKFLIQGVRPDGRALTKARKTTISVGSVTSALGSSFVKIGNTAVICGIKGELGPYDPITTPTPLIVNAELPALCGPQFRPGKPSDQTQVISQTLNSLGGALINGKELKLEMTPEEIGPASWYLYADLYCLDYGGNVGDAALIALLAALHDVRLPAITFDEHNQAVIQKDPATPGKRIQVLHHPVALTFGLVEDYLLMDPTTEEETLITGSLTITINEKGELCSLEKPGGPGIDDNKLDEAMKMAVRRSKEIYDLIQATKRPYEFRGGL